MMIASGEDILWVSSMLGDKNSNITLSTYAKYMKNDKKSRGTFLLNQNILGSVLEQFKNRCF